MASQTTDAGTARSASGATARGSGSDPCVLALEEVGRRHAAAVGGKAVHLGELSRIDGVDVPPGFCVTTAAYRRLLAETPSIHAALEHLARVDPDDWAALRERSAQLRQRIEQAGMPAELERAITAAVARLGAGSAYAVRSSATAEDLPTGSAAGQHDSALDVVGLPAILRQVSRCWASLFSERAVAYRGRHGIDHRAVAMAVVVQQMVRARASGVLFTAHPVSGNRTIASVEATSGLGDALVAGTVDADRYEVRDGKVVATKVADETRAALTDAQAVALVAFGRRIEARLGSPQDIEWCWDGRGFQIVQSRPITALYPIPEIHDGANHVYISVGHQQMMTEPMTPLGLSLWQLTSSAPMHVAGGRLYVDATAPLSSPATRGGLLAMVRRSDPLTADALETVLGRGDFLPITDEDPALSPRPAERPEATEIDPAIVTDLVERDRASVAALQQEIRDRTGPELFDFILADIEQLRGLLLAPQNHQAVMAAFESTWWLNDRLQEWLGEPNAADVLSLAAPGNVTAEMGLALLDVADAIRPHPQVVAFLRAADGDDFLDGLAAVEGGRQAHDAITDYLDSYGMRCVGEIDIGRPRWRERPSALLPLILSNVDNFEPGERERRVEDGRQRARAKEQELLQRLRALPDGANKASQTERMIRRLRAFVGYREYPKYGMVSRYAIYKQALLEEAERLVTAGVLHAIDDIFFLSFSELHDVARGGRADRDLIARRRHDFRRCSALRPPRVLTSEGEALDGAYRRDDVPAGALVGLAVSGGTVEGRARVLHDMTEAAVEPGDILVTPHTDPSWSPLFVTVAGLVTEVGGLMTHGAVIAREYGLAAVVGVKDATGLIRDGQRVRVDGTTGVVELLPDLA